MKKALISICLAGFLSNSAVLADSRTRAEGVEVDAVARGETPYLENVRGVGAILRNNVMGLLDPSAPQFSIIKSIIYSKRILKVARLFAYGSYTREMESNPKKYGSGDNLTTKQMRARSAYLSENLRIVFKRGYKGLLSFNERAKNASDDFYYRIKSVIATRNPAEQFEFSRWEALTYLKLIEEEGHFQEKGPRYTHVYSRTGAKEKRYFFTWTTVTIDKLATAIVNDRFLLMKQVRKEALSTEPDFEDSVCSPSHDKPRNQEGGSGSTPTEAPNTPTPEESEGGDDSIPDDIPLPDFPDEDQPATPEQPEEEVSLPDDIPMPEFLDTNENPASAPEVAEAADQPTLEAPETEPSSDDSIAATVLDSDFLIPDLDED